MFTGILANIISISFNLRPKKLILVEQQSKGNKATIVK